MWLSDILVVRTHLQKCLGCKSTKKPQKVYPWFHLWLSKIFVQCYWGTSPRARDLLPFKFDVYLSWFNCGVLISLDPQQRCISSSSFLWFPSFGAKRVPVPQLTQTCPRVMRLLFATTISWKLDVRATGPSWTHSRVSFACSSWWRRCPKAHQRQDYRRLQTRRVHKGHQSLRTSIGYCQWELLVLSPVVRWEWLDDKYHRAVFETKPIQNSSSGLCQCRVNLSLSKAYLHGCVCRSGSGMCVDGRRNQLRVTFHRTQCRLHLELSTGNWKLVVGVSGYTIDTVVIKRCGSSRIYEYCREDICCNDLYRLFVVSVIGRKLEVIKKQRRFPSLFWFFDVSGVQLAKTALPAMD